MIPKSKIEGYELVPSLWEMSCLGCAFLDSHKCQMKHNNSDCMDFDLIYQPTKPTNDELQRPELPISE
jgi:hypothetical protein